MDFSDHGHPDGVGQQCHDLGDRPDNQHQLHVQGDGEGVGVVAGVAVECVELGHHVVAARPRRAAVSRFSWSGWPPPDEPIRFYSLKEHTMKQTYVAVEGDSLYSIARRFYNDEAGDKVALIAAASGVFDPYDVQPGQIITIP